MLSLFGAVVFILFLLMVAASLRWYATIPVNLPPGPRGLPFVGSMFHSWNASICHTKMQEWRKSYGPLFKFYIAERLVVVLGDWNMIKEAFVKQGDAFANRPHLHLAHAKDRQPGAGKRKGVSSIAQ